MACATCRARKIRCDRSLPVCQNCQLRSSHCIYVGERRKRRWANPTTETSRLFLANRSHQSEHGDDTQSRGPTRRALSQFPEIVDDNGDFPRRDERDATGSHEDAADSLPDDALRGEHVEAEGSEGSPFQLADPPNAQIEGGDDNESLLDKILGGEHIDSLRSWHPAVWIRVDDGDEYTGPSSGISTISDLGLEWIRHHVPDSDVLCSAILDIRTSVLSHLRQPKCVPPGPYSMPSTSLSLKAIRRSKVTNYVDAYFSIVQTIFPILDRVEFEGQLLKYGLEASENRFSWNALLNAVLASGCRAALSDETAKAFQESGSEAWDYFQNALFYESKMVHGATDLLAVQALAVMTVFTQGMSSPQRLEYVFASEAARLAHSLALNHCPPREWGLAEREQQERSRVFWIIYCLDQTIALRCGRPPVFHDDDISCPFPRNVQGGPGQNAGLYSKGQGHGFDFFLSLTKLARILGMIARGLYSASALSLPAPRVNATAMRILAHLESWRQFLPSDMRPGKPFGKICGASGVSQTHLLVLHSTYYYVICAIYRRFTPMFARDGKDARHLLSQSANATHIEAARSLVLLTKYLDIESFTPGWLVFYYPFTALTTLFMHVICNRPDRTTQNDIALMEVVVGFFGRLEYITSGEAAFTKTTEFVRQARSVMNNSPTSHTVVQLPSPADGQTSSGSGSFNHFSEVDIETIALYAGDESNSTRQTLPDLIADTHAELPNLQPETRANGDTGSISLPGAPRFALPGSLYPSLTGNTPFRSEDMPDEDWPGLWIATTQSLHMTC